MIQARPIRVLVIDDHETVRQGLAIMFEVMDNFEFVGDAADGEHGLMLCATLRPDVVLVEMRLNVSDGLTITRLVRKSYPQIKVIVMSASEDDQDIHAAFQAGASGYLVKNVGIDDIAAAIREVVFDA